MAVMLSKFGGLISEGCDQFSKKKNRLKKNELTFSHGRSAMIWLIRNKNFKSALVCNYTWPAIPTLLKKLKLKVHFYDLFQKNLDDEINKTKGKLLIIVSVFYGFKPWINYKKIQKKFKNKVFILVDGAQTAYAHKDYSLPDYGAILSCPHKSLGISDGAILKLTNFNDFLKKKYNLLLKEKKFSDYKKLSRQLTNSGNSSREKIGLKYSKKLEETWKSMPEKKMSIKSLNNFLKIDPKKHKKNRLRNFFYVKNQLRNLIVFPKNLKPGCPYGFPILHKKRDKVVKLLHQKRVFCTSLWKDNKYSQKKYKNSIKYQRNFMALPIDQRYKINDLRELTKRVKLVLKELK